MFFLTLPAAGGVTRRDGCTSPCSGCCRGANAVARGRAGALGKDNELSSRTLPPWSYSLLGRCASGPLGLPQFLSWDQGPRSPAQKPQALPTTLGRCWKGVPEAESCRPGTSLAEEADAESRASRASPA